jgi:hypothetical protein
LTSSFISDEHKEPDTDNLGTFLDTKTFIFIFLPVKVVYNEKQGGSARMGIVE